MQSQYFVVRIGVLYIISGLGGSLLSALFIKSSISVGASGALFGLLGSMLSELLINWSIYENKVLFTTWIRKHADYVFRVKSLNFVSLFFPASPDSGFGDPGGHHCYQSSTGASPACGQLCSYRRVSIWFFPWFCVSNPPPFRMG